MAERESQIVIRVDTDTLRAFKAGCLLRGLTPTQEYGRLLTEQVVRWQAGDAAGVAEGEERH